jgi:hypothetical protein
MDLSGKYGKALGEVVKQKGYKGKKRKSPFEDISGFNPYSYASGTGSGKYFKLGQHTWKKPEELIAHGYVYDVNTKEWALPTETPIGTTNIQTGETWGLPEATTIEQPPTGMRGGQVYPTTPLPTNTSQSTTGEASANVPPEQGTSNIFNLAPNIFGGINMQVGTTLVLDGINPDGTYRWKVVSQNMPSPSGGRPVNIR